MGPLRCSLLVFGVFCLAASAGAATRPAPRLGVGVNYVGGQVAYQCRGPWRAEARYQTGQEGSGDSRSRAAILGLRAYRFFKGEGRTRAYLGLEAAHVSASQKAGEWKAQGLALGGFVGLERALGRRLALGFDIGPYVIGLEENSTRVRSTDVEFVANTFLMFWVF